MMIEGEYLGGDFLGIDVVAVVNETMRMRISWRRVDVEWKNIVLIRGL